MLKSDFILKVMQRTTENPEATLGEVMAESWYEMLSDTDQAEFWTQLVMLIGRHYPNDTGRMAIELLLSELDKHISPSVRNTLTANLRSNQHLMSGE